MHKILKLSAVISSLITTTYMMADLQPSPPQEATTVAKVLTETSAIRVTLIGKITKKVKGEKYEFQDSTGTINVKIGAKEWEGVSIDSNTTVKIIADLEKGFVTDSTMELVVVKTIETVPEKALPQTDTNNEK